MNKIPSNIYATTAVLHSVYCTYNKGTSTPVVGQYVPVAE